MFTKNIKVNFIFNSIYQLSSIIIPIITLPYLTRCLHAGGLGEYAFAYSVAYFFYMFIRLGLHNYGNRTIAYVKDDIEILSKTFWEIYAFQVFMGVIMAILYLGYCHILSPNKTLAYIFFMMVFAGEIDLTWVLYGLEEFKVTSIRDVSIKIITAICIFLFVKNEGDVWKYAIIYNFGFLISQFVALTVIHNRIHFIKPEYKKVISHIKPNVILFLPTVAISVYKTMDKIMLGSMSNEAELGYYHASENIIMVPLALITALGTVMLPRMSNMLAQKGDGTEIREVFDKSISFAMFLSTSLCLGIMTVAKEFIPLYFGDGFEKCNTLFIIILPSCIFLAFANVIRTQYLLPRKKDNIYIISLFSGAIVNLVINLIMIPKYESVGAAIGTLIAEMCVCIIQTIYVFKEINIKYNIFNSIPYIVSGILMYLIFRGYTPMIDNAIIALTLKVIISAAFYLFILALMRFGLSYIKKRLVGNSCP